MPDISTLEFLKKLEKNNNKTWFEEHRDEYDRERTEFQVFASTVITEVAKFDASVKDLDPKKCVLRMHRDQRFTKNKPPYHSAFRLAFSKGGQSGVAVAYYMNYEPGNMFVGGGLVGAPTEVVNKVRQEIEYNWKDFEKILAAKDFRTLFGDLMKTDEYSLKRPPKGYGADNPAIEYLKLKNFVARRWIKKEDLSPGQLLEEVVASFKASKPFLDFVERNLG